MAYFRAHLTEDLRDLFLHQSAYAPSEFKRQYVLDVKVFNPINDCTHVGIPSGTTLYDLVMNYLWQFGDEDIRQAIGTVQGKTTKRFDVDRMFIDMCLKLDLECGLFFTGKFDVLGQGPVSIYHIVEMVKEWLNRRWSFRHFDNVVHERLFILAFTARIMYAVDEKGNKDNVVSITKEFINNMAQRDAVRLSEKIFDECEFNACIRTERALEVATFASKEKRDKLHAPSPNEILKFIFGRNIPANLRDTWFVKTFVHDVDFSFVGRLNVVYKPRSTFLSMEKLKEIEANAVENEKARLIQINRKRKSIPNRQLKTWRYNSDADLRQQFHTFHQAKKQWDVLNELNGHTTSERLQREMELKARALRDSFVFSRLLWDFPLMNRIIAVKPNQPDGYKICVLLPSDSQRAKEKAKRDAKYHAEMDEYVEKKLAMRRRIAAITKCMHDGKVFSQLSEDERVKYEALVETEKTANGELLRWTEEYRDEFEWKTEIEEPRVEDTYVIYTYDVTMETVPNPDDFIHTTENVLAINSADRNLYLSERIRSGVWRVLQNRQITYADYMKANQSASNTGSEGQ